MTLVRIASYIGIIGAVFVAAGIPLYANIVWSLSNPYFVYFNYKTQQYSQAKMFGVFSIISLLGVYNLW